MTKNHHQPFITTIMRCPPSEPINITKNRAGDTVLMNIEAFPASVEVIINPLLKKEKFRMHL